MKEFLDANRSYALPARVTVSSAASNLFETVRVIFPKNAVTEQETLHDSSESHRRCQNFRDSELSILYQC
jgi:hypothetical protein